MRPDTEAYLLLLRQRASRDAIINADLIAWISRREGSIAEVMDKILAARGDDAGRFIGGARKDKGMFTQMLVTAGVLSAENLAALEAQGEEAAYREITRDKLIPKRTPAMLKELGDSSPVAFLKVALRDMITPRPYNSPQARAKFVQAASAVNTIFDTAYTASSAFFRDLKLNYLHRVAKDDPEAELVSEATILAAIPSANSWARVDIYAQQKGFKGYDNADKGFYVLTTKERIHRVRLRETEEEAKNRESVEQPLGSRFYDAVSQGNAYYGKTKWDAIISDFRKIRPDDWSWAATSGGVQETAAIPEEERAEPLTREEVIEPPDCAQMKEDKEHPTSAYMYAWAYKNLVPKKSLGTKTARGAYETALEAFERVMADRSSKYSIATMLLRGRESFTSNPKRAVLPYALLDPKLEREAREYVGQEGFSRKTPQERAQARIAFLEEELGVTIDSEFSGPYYAKGERAPQYYRIALPPEEVEALVADREHARNALQATSNDLFRFLEGNLPDAARKILYGKAWKADWSDVEALCASIAKEAEKGGGRRFAEPERGVIGPRVGPVVPGPHTSDSIEKSTGLYAVEHGRWMNAADKAAAHVSLAEALHDLADALGIPLPAVSLGKRLAIALGSRGQGGQASAHYEPYKKVINMTRTKGSGALAHEWGHALDHWLADKGESSRLVNGRLTARFASLLDGTDGMQGVDVTPEERKAVNDALMGVTDILLAGKEEYDEARKRRWREEHPQVYERPKHPRDTGAWQFDNYFRARVGLPDYYSSLPAVKPTPNARWEPGDAEHVDALYRWEAEKKARNEAEIRFLQMLDNNAKNNAMLKAAKAAGGYWYRGQEMFARAWESFVMDKLAKEGRMSGYLVRGTKVHPVYPLGEQRDKLYDAFTVFLDTLRPILRRIAVRPNGRGRTRKPWTAHR